ERSRTMRQQRLCRPCRDGFVRAEAVRHGPGRLFGKSNEPLIPMAAKVQFTAGSVFFLILLPLEKFVLTDGDRHAAREWTLPSHLLIVIPDKPRSGADPESMVELRSPSMDPGFRCARPG
ncbi:hypothetical protein, partial [Bosea sp. ASV33]|uniref:hypothetical protein n=1 Tax=Bosea sp. ASV33 TaxID=2795106 RepID=UPI001AEEDE33